MKEGFADLLYEQSDNSYTHDGVMRVLSFVFITVQNDTRNTGYLISWLQKISLEQLLFD